MKNDDIENKILHVMELLCVIEQLHDDRSARGLSAVIAAAQQHVDDISNSLGKKANAVAANKPHNHYEFGTLEQRLDHACALMDIERPQIAFDDDLIQENVEWFSKNNINMDWVLIGSPCGLLRNWASSKAQDKATRDFLKNAA